MTGNFYPNSDIDKLYVDRKSGGGGLRSIKIMFESRLVALRQHLTHSKNRNKIIHYIHESEIDNILRVANNLINSQNIEDNKNDHPRKISSKYVKMNRKNLNGRYTLREKCPNTEFFLFSHSDQKKLRIWTLST